MTAKSKGTVMIVDDVRMNIDLLVAALGDEYTLAIATDGGTALAEIAINPPDLVLLDIMMPGMDGFEVCRHLKAAELTRHIPVIFLTALNEEGGENVGLKLGAIDYLTKPFNPALVKARVDNHLQLKHYQDRLEEMVRERTLEVALAKEVVIDGLATLAEFRDPETAGHIQRTKHFIRALAEGLQPLEKFRGQLTAATIELLFKSAPLHDIGKVGVPDHILLKPAGLTADEFEVMKRHTLYGAKALLKTGRKLPGDSFLACAGDIARTHHERWDGSGYPCGLKGEEIPLPGRLMAIVDVYDALISARPYKAAMPHAQAMEIVCNGNVRTMPTHFDPDVLMAFKAQEKILRGIAREFADPEKTMTSQVGNFPGLK